MAETQLISEEIDSETKEGLRSSPIPNKIAVDNSLEGLQNVAEVSLDRLDESASDGSVSAECIPGPLPKEGRALTQIKESLLGLISKCEEEDPTLPYNRGPSSELGKASLLSHTMGAYVSALEPPVLRRIARRLHSDTALWIASAFKFPGGALFGEESECLVRVVRLLLLSRYPRYSTTGYEALFTRPPVLYAADTHSHQLAHAAAQLGLPLSCLTAVPVDQLFRMDAGALERLVREDVSASRTPLLVLCGEGVLGATDPLPRIRDICRQHNLHLHLQGHALAALATHTATPPALCDSMSLRLGDWIGLPSLPNVTLYGGGGVSGVHLECLPVWFALQTLGTRKLQQLIAHAFHMTDVLLQKLEEMSELRILSPKRSSPGKEATQECVLESAVSVVVFQYGSATQEKNPPYYDNLNSWLAQTVSRAPPIRTEVVESEAHGVALRVCFLESVCEEAELEQFALRLREQVEIVSATVRVRRRLSEEAHRWPRLQLVPMDEWAGLGGVRFVPESWLGRLNELTDTGKADMNHLNAELVDKLKQHDAAFSLGEGDEDGMSCVRFGMVDSHLDLDELMQLVTRAGQDIEEANRFLASMSEVVKAGIQEANKELVQENKMLQEGGVLRHVPVLGSLVSWWYPPSNGIKGRSFHLHSGTIESTENIYKYHMQVKEEH